MAIEGKKFYTSSNGVEFGYVARKDKSDLVQLWNGGTRLTLEVGDFCKAAMASKLVSDKTNFEENDHSAKVGTQIEVKKPAKKTRKGRK